MRESATLDELVAVAQTDSDTVVAGMAGVEAVARSQGSDEPSAVLDSLLTGPALVRRAVLDALADRGDGGAAAERHLFDRSPAVRAAAQRAYRRPDADPVAVYRAALARAEHVPIALVELAQRGSSDDHAAIIAALVSGDVATRRAAVSAVRWFAGPRLPELITPLLWDPSAGVTRAVERRLRARAGDLEGRMLLDLTGAPQSHSRRAAYRLMRRRSAAERVEADLIAVADEDPHLRRDGLADLRSWLHRGAASAPRADLPTRRRLSERLDAVEGHLRRDDVAENPLPCGSSTAGPAGGDLMLSRIGALFGRHSTAEKRHRVIPLADYGTSLKADLKALPQRTQAAFAASCAERLFPAYVAFLDASGRDDHGVVRQAIDTAWDGARSGTIPAGDPAGLYKRCLALIPVDGPDADQIPAYADDAVASAAYAPRGSGWACRRCRGLRSRVRDKQPGRVPVGERDRRRRAGFGTTGSGSIHSSWPRLIGRPMICAGWPRRPTGKPQWMLFGPGPPA